jgi:hypothetical protein
MSPKVRKSAARKLSQESITDLEEKGKTKYWQIDCLQIVLTPAYFPNVM